MKSFSIFLLLVIVSLAILGEAHKPKLTTAKTTTTASITLKSTARTTSTTTPKKTTATTPSSKMTTTTKTTLKTTTSPMTSTTARPTATTTPKKTTTVTKPPCKTTTTTSKTTSTKPSTLKTTAKVSSTPSSTTTTKTTTSTTKPTTTNTSKKTTIITTLSSKRTSLTSSSTTKATTVKTTPTSKTTTATTKATTSKTTPGGKTTVTTTITSRMSTSTKPSTTVKTTSSPSSTTIKNLTTSTTSWKTSTANTATMSRLPTTLSRTTTTQTTSAEKTSTTISLPGLLTCSIDGSSQGMCEGMCGNADAGIIKSPNYPDDYGNSNRDCQLSIDAPIGMGIQLEFTAINLKNVGDLIEIRDKHHNILVQYGPFRSENPAGVATITNRMYIRFVTYIGNTKKMRSVGRVAAGSSTTITSRIVVHNWRAILTVVAGEGTTTPSTTKSTTVSLPEITSPSTIQKTISAGPTTSTPTTTTSQEERTTSASLKPSTTERETTTTRTKPTISSTAPTTAETTTVSQPTTIISSTTQTISVEETTTSLTTPKPVPLITCSTRSSWGSNCGELCVNVTSTGGVVQSPNFPGYYNYKNGSWDCSVAIRVPAGSGIQITINTIVLDVDAVFKIRDPNFELWPTKSTGTSVPVVVNSTANNIVIEMSKRYVANRPNVTIGSNWHATFTLTDTPFLDFIRCSAYIVTNNGYSSAADFSECGKICHLMTSSGYGVVQSPNFPLGYGNDDLECALWINVLNGRKINLTFTAFNVETGHDSVSVSDGYSGNSGYLYKATGSTVPVRVTSTTDRMTIGFSMKNSFQSSSSVYGWQANVATVEAPPLDYVTCSYSTHDFTPGLGDCRDMCVNATSTGSGIVQSPNFPGDYRKNNRICKITILVPSGKTIQLKFDTFNVDTEFGSVSVYDGRSIYLLVRETGSTIPEVVTSTDNAMTIDFDFSKTSEPSSATYGWRATYTVVTPSLDYSICTSDSPGVQDCEGMCVNETSMGSGVIQSPKFLGDYGTIYIYCGVSITAPEGRRINLAFTTFNLEKGYDSITVRDGRYNSLLNGVTGSTIPAVVTSTDNIMNVFFLMEDSPQSSNGTYRWQATYTVV